MQELRSSRVTRGRSSETSQLQSSSGRPSRKSASSERVTYSEKTMTTRKRSRSNVSEDERPLPKKTLTQKIPEFRTKIVDGKECKIDAYCWNCHQLCEELDCPYCIRTYHKHCLKKAQADSSEFCECRLTSVSGEQCAFFPEKSFSETLRRILFESAQERSSSLKKNSGGKFKFINLIRTWPKVTENPLLVRMIDLDYVFDNLDDITWYKGTADFFDDVKWIYHNCVIVYGPDNSITQMTQMYLKIVKQELIDMEACFECYTNRNHNFTNVCREPHPIVWAKLRGFSFWPAKCLRVNNGHADVRFFGTHDKSVISLDQVFKISHEPPSKGNQNNRSSSTRITSATLKLNEAMKELIIYVAEYERLVGSFKYYDVGLPLVRKVRISSRKGRNRRGKSRSQNVSLNESISDGDDAISETGDSSMQQVKPSLNLSVLHDDTKVKALGLPYSAKTFSKETNDESSGPMINMVCEVSHEITQDDFIEEPPASQCSFSGNQSGDVSGSSSSNTDLSSIKETVINTAQDKANSGQFVNANTSNSLPVITSAMSPFDVTSTHVVVDNSLNALTGFSSSSSNDTVASNIQRFLEISSKKDADGQIIDDECQMLQESRQPNALPKFLKDTSTTKTLCELLLSNRPNARRQLHYLQTALVQCYLHMWLDINGKPVGSSEFNTFYNIYADLVSKINRLEGENTSLKTENASLKTENASLKAENKSLKAENDKLSIDVSALKNKIKTDLRDGIKNELMQAQVDKYNERIRKQKDEIQEKERNLKMCEEEKEKNLKMYEEEKSNYENNQEKMEEQLKEMKTILEEYIMLLKEKEQELEQFKNDSNKIVSNAESQTDVSGAISEKNDCSSLALSEKSLTSNILKDAETISGTPDPNYVDIKLQTLFYVDDPPAPTFQPIVTTINPFVSSNQPMITPAVMQCPTVLNATQLMVHQNGVMQAAQMLSQQNTQVFQSSSYMSSEATQVSYSTHNKPLKTYAGSKLRSASKNHSKKCK